MDETFQRELSAHGVLGIGTDLVEVERVRRALERHGDRFLRRVFTEGEIAYCAGLKHPWPHYAARFAAKEAVSKCFGTGICGDFGWKSLDVSKDARGRPLAKLDAQGQALLMAHGAREVLLSLTHTQTLAQAVAILVG